MSALNTKVNSDKNTLGPWIVLLCLGLAVIVYRGITPVSPNINHQTGFNSIDITEFPELESDFINFNNFKVDLVQCNSLSTKKFQKETNFFQIAGNTYALPTCRVSQKEISKIKIIKNSDEVPKGLRIEYFGSPEALKDTNVNKAFQKDIKHLINQVSAEVSVLNSVKVQKENPSDVDVVADNQDNNQGPVNRKNDSSVSLEGNSSPSIKAKGLETAGGPPSNTLNDTGNTITLTNNTRREVLYENKNLQIILRKVDGY